jgi:uncharacterized repeat protein (TIGR03803 family)
VRRAIHWLTICILLCAAIPAPAWAAQQLHGHVPAVVRTLRATGRLNGAQHLQLAISLPLPNQQGLSAFLSQLQDPASPDYHKYLTPAQFTERFGPSRTDYDAVVAFAQAHGLRVTKRHPNRMIVDVDGSVSDIEKALHVTMRTYRHPTEARDFYAPDTEPTLDLTVPVLRISGLDNYSLPKPRFVLNSPRPAAGNLARTGVVGSLPIISLLKPVPNAGSGPGGAYMGNDFRTAYVPDVTLTGLGQSVGLVQFDGYTPSDITYYELLTGRQSVTLTNVLLDGFDGQPTGDGGEIEVSLDIEMAISMAPGVSSIILYEAGPDGIFDDVLNRMATDDLAKQLSCSWYLAGAPADPVADQIFQEMAAQGQSFFCASGDNDAYSGLIPFPEDNPFITLVGGTELTTGAGEAYGSESVWNWGSGTGSGGGVSTQYSIPPWQQGINMTANLGSTTMRNVPDVALVASNVYVRADGVNYNAGGTSCAAPLWGALTALVNQQAVANGASTVGFLNPALYAIGQGANYSAAFHDITSGNNFQSGGPDFPAETGYDLCTGWGTPTGTSIINALAGPPTPIISTSSPLPNGAVNQAYSQTLAAGGGAPPYTWSISAGSLPAGLSLGTSGAITGTPSATGTASFTVQVTDNNSASSTAAFNLTIYAQGTPVITSASPLATGTLGMTYSQTLTESGGVSPYTWSVVSGSLPSGLSLSTGGSLSGTPAQSGTFDFTVQVTDNNGNTSDTPLVLVVPSAPMIFSDLSATGSNGAPFSYEITATGDPTSFGATGLPSGLTVNGTTGVISGTPTTIGTSSVTITASSTLGTGSAALTIAIVYLPVPVITSSTTTSGVNGAAFGYQIAATSYSGTYGATGLPSGLTVNGATGLISGTPTTAGTFTSTISAGNVNGTGSATLTISIQQMPAPVIVPLTAFCSFTGTNGAEPAGGLVQANDGNFYGTTYTGGTANYGTFYKVTTSGSLTVLHTFTDGTDGASSTATPIQATDGNLYGTAQIGGAHGAGTIFKISTSGSLNTLYSFPGGNSGLPVAAVYQGSDGNFYGTAAGTGTYNGIVYKITPQGSLTTLHTFTGGNDGQYPEDSLIQATNGVYYGTTLWSGTGGAGTVFSITSAGSLTTLCSFNFFDDEAEPTDGLVQASDGNFYGTTTGYFLNVGTVFKVTPSGTLTTLHEFNGATGGNPLDGLVQGSDGNLYGTTYFGGEHGYGSVFQITTSGSLTTVYSFTGGNDGAEPYSSLTLGADGNFYGTTSLSGSSGGGTVYTVVPFNLVTAFVGLPFRYQISASSNTAPSGYSATTLPAGLSLNSSTGLITGTPTTAGSFSVTVGATNPGGTGYATLTITVNQAPVISGSSILTGTAGVAASYQIQATNSPTSYSTSGLPSGLSLNSSSGLIAGTPTTWGTSTFTATASNAYGTGTATLFYNIAPPPPPVITSTTSVTGTNYAAVSYQIGAIYLPTSYGLIGTLPTGLTFNSSTGQITGSATQTGTFDLTVTASNIDGTGSASLVITVNQMPAPAINPVNTLCSFSGSNGAYPDGPVIKGTDGNFYGTTYQGGTYGWGSVFRMTASGSLTTLHSFSLGIDGGGPVAGLVQGSDGNLYGTTYGGGSDGDGVAFKLSLSGSLTVLHSFTGGGDGEFPRAGLVQGSDGNFYGTTSNSNSESYWGTVYKLTPTGTLTTLHSFTDGNDGGEPEAPLVQGTDGNFYGTAAIGGANGYGVVFKITPSGTFTALNSFNEWTDGSSPLAGLFQGSDGNFYGTTNGGGANNEGTLFRITASGTLTSLYSFTGGSDGGGPLAGLVQALDGNFYGTTSSGGADGYGTLFETSTAGVVTPLDSFTDGNDGASPHAPLVQETNGIFYGTTYSGGANGNGTVFSMVPFYEVPGIVGVPFSYQINAASNLAPSSYSASGLPGWLSVNSSTGLITGTPTTTGTFSFAVSAVNLGGTGSASLTLIVNSAPVITSAPSVTGTVGFPINYQVTATYNPTSYGASGLPSGLSLTSSTGLISGTPTTAGSASATISASNVYGTGTAPLSFAIAQMLPPSFNWPSFTSLYSFTNGTDQGDPICVLTQGSDGNFYGTTHGPGPAYPYGTVFKMTVSGSLTTIYTFTDGNDGRCPCGGVVQATNGNFYGTTSAGGANGGGTIFSVTSSGSLTTLYSFSDGADGGQPLSAPVEGSDGNFYGTTGTGGANGYGTIYKITPSGTYTTVCSFTNPDTCSPPLVQGTDGNFYGTTYSGGANYGGTIYKVTPTGTLTTLCSLGSGSEGFYPAGPLVQGSDGNFYGTTYYGGEYGSGTVFMMTPGGAVTTLYSFTSGSDGGGPKAGLLLGSDGNFYGTTCGGGASNEGTVFRVTSSGSLTTLFSFNGANAQPPTMGLVEGNNGVLYGVTPGIGGIYGYGTVYAISLGNAATATQGAPFSYQLGATSYAPPVYSASGLPAGLSINPSTGLISGTPTSTGTFSFTVSAANLGGTTTSTFTITTGVPPVITSSGTVSGTGGEPLSYQITATNSPTIYGAIELPAGLSIDQITGVISGTPVAGGTTTTTITAGNIYGSGSASLQINLVAPVPTITSPATATGTNGLPFSFQVTASNSPTSYQISGTVPGLSLNSSTGVISGTPTLAGTFNVTLSAANINGTGGGSNLAVTVIQMPAPVINYPFSTLYSFNGTTGANPAANLVQGSDGNFYGTTAAGGSSNLGTVFKITPAGVLTTLCSFSGANGKTPQAGLIQWADGNYYGTTTFGGAYNFGTVFKITPTGSLTTLCSFNNAYNGANPAAGLVQGIDGNFYGTASEGNPLGAGTVFEMTPAGVLNTICPFNFTNGEQPMAGLVRGSGTDPNLYGTTYYGGPGSDYYGTVFKITTSGVLTRLYTINGSSNGAFPVGTLVTGTDGKLYGTTTSEGADNHGTLFKVTTAGSWTTLYSFTGGDDGGSPVAGLVQAIDGNFYGTTGTDGAYGDGTVFMATSAGTLTTVGVFAGANGSDSQASLIQATNGTLYGTTYTDGAYGDGTIFTFVPSTLPTTTGTLFNYQINAYSYTPPTYGASGLPSGLSVNSTSGVISGTATATGTFNATISATNPGGTGDGSLTIIVKTQPTIPVITSATNVVTTTGWPFSYEITASNYPTSFTTGTLPSNLSVNSATGVISGTVAATGTTNITISGSNSYGLGSTTLKIVSVKPPAPVLQWPLVTLCSFDGTNGQQPEAGVIQGLDGNLYGTTLEGGTDNYGTVFMLTTSGSLNSLYSFRDGSDGGYPEAPLVQTTTGVLYGTAIYGGTAGAGTFYSVTTSGSFAPLFSFYPAFGDYPQALALGNDGNFYGMAEYGGADYAGSVYKISTSGSATLLHTFEGTDGAYPEYCGLVQATNGDLYGMTTGGGNGYGNSFQITTTGTFHSYGAFNGSTYDNPEDTFIQASDGNLYGTTEWGGSNELGNIIKLTTSGGLSSVFSLSGTNGMDPKAGVIQGGDGNLYGTTYFGGAAGWGTIYQASTSGSQSVVYSFTGGNDGGSPQAPVIQATDGRFYGTTTVGGAYGDGVVFSLTPFSVSASVGVPFSYQITTSASTPASSYSASNLPPGVSINTSTGLISGTPSSAGVYSSTISAISLGGTTTATLTITVP